MSGTETRPNGRAREEKEREKGKASLLSSGGTWRPPTAAAAAQGVTRPGTSGSARPSSGLVASRVFPHAAAASGLRTRPGSRGATPNADGAALFDQAGVLYSSHLYSQAVEERVIEQEVRRQAKTLPEKTSKPGTPTVVPPNYSAAGELAHQIMAASSAVLHQMGGAPNSTFPPRSPHTRPPLSPSAGFAHLQASPSGLHQVPSSLFDPNSRPSSALPRASSPPHGAGHAGAGPGAGAGRAGASGSKPGSGFTGHNGAGGTAPGSGSSNRFGPPSTSIGQSGGQRPSSAQRPISASRRASTGWSPSNSRPSSASHPTPRTSTSSHGHRQQTAGGADLPPHAAASARARSSWHASPNVSSGGGAPLLPLRPTSPPGASPSPPVSPSGHDQRGQLTTIYSFHAMDRSALEDGLEGLGQGVAGNGSRPPSASPLPAHYPYPYPNQPNRGRAGSAGRQGSGGGGAVRPASGRPASAALSTLSLPVGGVLSGLKVVLPTGSGSCRPGSAFTIAAAAVRTNQAALALSRVGESWATQPVHDEEYGDVMTSQHVVDYFTRHGASADKKLFYLNKAKASGFLEVVSPFDLLVVPHDKVEPEHWTMSSAGVVHIEPGGGEGEFMQLGEWMRLASVYGILRKLRFFKHFLLARSFRRWRSTVTAVHFVRTQRRVGSGLYSVMPTFQPVLSRIASIVYDIAQVPLTSFVNHPDKIYVMDKFVDEQLKHLDKSAAPSISDKLDAIMKLLASVSHQCESEKLKMEGMTDVQELVAAGLVVGMPSMHAGKGGKSKSISQLKQDMEQLLEAYMRCSSEVSRLRSLVTLVDYMVAEAYVSVAISAMQALLNFFEDPSRVRGSFSTVVSFCGDGYAFSPDQTLMTDGLDRVLGAWLQLVSDLPRPLSSKATVQKFALFNASALSVPDVLADTPRYCELRGALYKHLEDSFGEAAQYVYGAFEDKRPVEAFRLTWSASGYEAAGQNLATLRKDLQTQRRWSRLVEQMKYSSPVGILHVDSKRMRAELVESVRSTTEDMKATLLACASAQCGAVLERGRRWVSELQARPPGLDDYAGLCVRLSHMVRDKGELLSAGEGVDALYDLFKENGGRIDIKDQAHRQRQLAHDSMHEVLSEVRRLMEETTAWVAEQHESMRDALVRASGLLEEEATATLQRMNTQLGDPDSDPQSMLGLLSELGAGVEEMEARAQQLRSYQRTLKQPTEDFGRLVQVRHEYERRKLAWTTLSDWVGLQSRWLSDPVSSVRAEEVANTTEEYFRSVYKMCKLQRDDAVVMRAKDMVDEFKVVMPLIQEVCNTAMQRHHWEQAVVALGKDPEAVMAQGATQAAWTAGGAAAAPDAAAAAAGTESGSAPAAAASAGTGAGAGAANGQAGWTPPFSVQELQSWGALSQLEALSAISTTASKEASLRAALAKMKAEWEGKEFACLPYKDTGTCVVGHTDEIQMLLDDQLMKVQAMNASPFVKAFKADTLAWAATLQALQDLLDQWTTCQASWMYLEPIFSSPDIVKQMPSEGDKFRAVDTAFRSLMEEAAEAPKCVPMAQDPERLGALREANALLEEVTRGLAAYLEKKRLFFPRFFFLSNDEMLEILSETKDPTRVQPHLRKCFEGIHRLRFEGAVVTAMCSVEQEQVPLKTSVNTVQAKGSVERWLLEVEERMVEAVHDCVSRGITAYPSRKRHRWVMEWPGMVVLVGSGVYWTQGVEAALAQGGKAVVEEERRCSEELMRIVDAVRGELTGLQRATLGALVVMDVHSRDVVSELVRQGVTDAQDFGWQAQLRTYWQPVEELGAAREWTVVMRMMSSRLEYGYEYLGNSSRLVITPLTDRCYRTLMGAIHMNLGGAPEGPAGTGKTETTKDLAKAMARQCVVFNCSDGLDYLAMGKFFKGLAASGAWACFDEFNRIDLEVLSVVAQQVMDIQRAIAAKLTVFNFEGTDLQLKWSGWCAITMNPGYAGRSELPDNLKALFRTVAMMVPDYAMIAEIILFSYGYLRARECAKKIVQCYKLCSEQLSSQDHYDYGMRAVMAVLRAAGNLKRSNPKEDEFVLMLRSIIDVNLCKFLSHDVPLFQGIISDLFPGVALPKPDYDSLEEAIREACATANLQPTEYFMLKTIQLYEMIAVRHGLMIVGQPWSGKTCSYRMLAAALNLMHDKGQAPAGSDAIAGGDARVVHTVINPKSVTMGQLYGQFDAVSHEWSDGVLAVAFRKAATDGSGSRQWLVLDGPVDAVWIENMNTVLDDNKKLCLNSGEIIQMSPTMNLLFEVGDLAAASPATVSRCGMVYMEPHQLGWKPLLSSWLASLPSHLPAALRARLQQLFTCYGAPLMRFLRRELKHVKEANPTTDGSLATAWMRLLQAMALPIIGSVDAYRKLGDAKAQALLDALSVFALVWSAGCTAETTQGRALVSTFLRAALAGDLASYTSPSGNSYFTADTEHLPLAPAALPPVDGLMHDYVFDAQDQAWSRWTDLVAAEDAPIPADASYQSIIVPTADSATVSFLLRLAVEGEYPLLLVGPTGTGKTVYTQRYLLQLDPERYTPANLLGFSARTTANTTQQLIDAKLDKRRKGVYGPPPGKRAIVFVDDLNMPAKEVYGAQPPIELLRQFMDHGGWYARDNTFRHMQDVGFLAAMGPPGGGRTSVTSRYTRHFSTLALTDPSPASLMHIFCAIQTWFVNSHSFPQQVVALTPKVVAATLEVYSGAMAQLLPTPTKSHYVFNLRDFSRVIQGMQMQDCDALYASSNAFGGHGCDLCHQHIKLWAHEVLRVFYDRLVDEQEQDWFLGLLKDVTKSHFGLIFDSLFPYLLPPGTEPGSRAARVGSQHLRRLFFGDYMSEPDANGARAYVEIPDPDDIVSSMEGYLTDHNSLSKRPMNLAMFLYAVEHTSRVARVLRQQGGHMLCVGVGGSGRQSLARLAAFIAGMETFQVEISRSYGAVEWKEDLKRFCRHAGAENKTSVLLFSDTQIKDEGFVEDLNNLLNSGEVPNLFPHDERSAIGESVRELAKKEGRSLDTPQQLWADFVQRTRSNLHLVLCFSPVGDAFRERLRQFPSLINCCTIDWFHTWPQDALEAVGTKLLAGGEIPPDKRMSIMTMCKTFHTSVAEHSRLFLEKTGRHCYVTPTGYLELLTCYTTLMSKRRAEISTAHNRYEVGLKKLDFTAAQVELMRQELRALKPVLERTVAETEQLLMRIAHEKSQVVEPKKAQVDEEVKQADQKAQVSKAIKQDCETILAEAMPALNAAIAALDTIKTADIRLVQTFKNPPQAVKVVMEAVCVMLDVKPTMVADPNIPGKKIADYWDSSKKLLMDPTFIPQLKEYDRDNIPVRTIDKVRKDYTSDPDFTPANAAKASSAAEGLCKWVHAMDSYDKVAKVVAPKRASLLQAEAEYSSVMEGLQQKQEELSTLLSQLARLEEQLQQSIREKTRLEHEVEQCVLKLDRAEKLIRGLGGEKDRWTECARQLREQQQCLTGDLLLASAVLSYLGPFTAAYRDELTEKWTMQLAKAGITSSPGVFSLASVLGDPVRIRSWVIAGLPNDAFSIDNAIMATTARRWPLCIDPQKQANKWIRALEEPRGLKVLKPTEGGDYMRSVEAAVEFGLPVLLENVGQELDPSLEPLLLKQLFKQSGVTCIRLGDAVIEYSSSFYLYITTALRNPHYLPDIAVKVTLLNFMITAEGLSDQLLGVVVAAEMPDLEEQRQQLVVSSAENKRRLKEIEDQILQVLSSSEGNILEDATAVQILSEAKQVSDDITAKQAVAEETQERIDAARRGYRPCGEYNAALFFCIADLAGVDAMYQYSLSWFIGLFVRSISDSARTDVLSRRLEAINSHFTYGLYTNICRSLFEKDKLLFAFLLAAKVLTYHRQLPHEELQFLLTGGGAGLEGHHEAGSPGHHLHHPDNPDTSWISAKAWADICRLSRVGDAFHTLPVQMSMSPDKWRREVAEPALPSDPPAPFDTLTAFQQLLLLRCLRPDKLAAGMERFVVSVLGERFVDPPAFDLDACFADSSCTVPLLFVLSPGTDPTAALLKFAEDRKAKLAVISMGQGQGPKAEVLIEDARSLGSWVLLQNCHLAPSWMPALDRICEAINCDNTDTSFRLWMTSMPSAAFPPNVLQGSVKMTNEPPEGLRANMRRSLASHPIADPAFWEASSKPEVFKKLLFGLLFVHAFVQERRKFGPIGWNVPYGFDDGDLRISCRQVLMYVDEAKADSGVPFSALKYAIGECNYGGRVTDDKDRRLLTTLMAKVYCSDILKESFPLSESGLYLVPPDGPLPSYIQYVEGLPNTQLPEAFGLHENADISKDLNRANQILDAILATAGGGGSGAAGGAGAAAAAAAVAASVKDLLERLPPDFDVEAVQERYPVSYRQSMNQVLVQEMARYNRLLEVVRTSLLALDKALAGLQVMSAELEAVVGALALGKVPALWLAQSYPSLKPLGSYIEDLLARLDMLASWDKSGQPAAFWISGFFFTPSFTTAVLQNYARQHKLPIDEIGFDFEVLDSAVSAITKPPADGAYIHGLFLEGSRWDAKSRQLAESQPKVLFVPAPLIWLRPTRVTDMKAYQHYDCPVYRTTDRRGVLATTGHSTNFLMMIKFPTLTVAPEHWVLRGVCALCSLSD